MRRLGIFFLLCCSSALAHDGVNIESGSLNGGAQAWALVFICIFVGVLLLSLGGLIYSLLSARGLFSPARVASFGGGSLNGGSPGGGEAVFGAGPSSLSPSMPSSAAVPLQSKTPWPLAFGMVALISSGVLAFGVQNYLSLQNVPFFPTAVLYPSGWQVSYFTGKLEHTVTVQAGQISYLHLSAQTEDARLELPELGLRLPLPKAQKRDVQFVALRAGEYRSSSTPSLIIRSLEPQQYAAFVRGER